VTRDEDWSAMADFVLPPGTVGHMIQGALTQQRMSDIRKMRVTQFTTRGLRHFVDSVHREEIAHEVLMGEHDESETSEDT